VHFPACGGALRNGSLEIAGVRVEGRKGGYWFGKKRFFSGESLESWDGQSVNVKCQLVIEYHT
jgi:hypothetical protein